MNSSTSTHKSKNFLAHTAAAVVVLIHAYAKFTEGHGSYIVFAFAGAVILLVAIFHSRLRNKFPKIDLLFFTIEAILSLVMAYDYFHLEKKYLPFAYLFVAGLQFWLGFRKTAYN